MRSAMVFLMLLAVSANAERVVRVKDGDSLVIASGGKQVDVRLADIDAPEYGQRRGDEARAKLRALVEGKDVELHLRGGDAYRRIIAHVFVDGLDVNAAMVSAGLAWVARAFDPGPGLVGLEDQARAAGQGLWADAQPMPPWEWRKACRGQGARPECRSQAAAAARLGVAANNARGAPKRKGRTRTQSAMASVATLRLPRVRCGSKRHCREMTSCEEAVAFLRQCQAPMDGDYDGVPCERGVCAGYR